MTMKIITLRIAALSCLLLALSCAYGADEDQPVPLRAEITGALPMTGLVFWSTSEHPMSLAISMEFSYLRYEEVATARGNFDWSKVERLMSDAAARGHQLILRLHDTYPGRPSGVPVWIKASPGYRDITEKSEGHPQIVKS